MVRVLILSQTYWPSIDAASQLVEDIGRFLVEEGFDVHVVTPAVNYATGDLLCLREEVHGVHMWRTPALPFSRHSLVARIASLFFFGVFRLAASAIVPRPDVVLVVASPTTLGISAHVLRRYGGINTCLLLHDIYPEIAIRLGLYGLNLSSRSALARLWLSARDSGLHAYNHVVVIGEGMAQALEERGLERSRVSVIENWPSQSLVQTPARKVNPLLRKHGLLDKFVVQYSGNLGLLHDAQAIIEAAAILKDDAEIRFLVIGGGRRHREIMAAKREKGLHNIKVLPYQPRTVLDISLSAADVALVSLRSEVEGLAVPSKTYGALAAGVPVVFIGDADGETARLLRAADCGLTVSDGKGLAQTILALRNNPSRLGQLAANARRASLKWRWREAALSSYSELMSRLANADV
ncbi:MAG: hypothetical protein A2341_09445 [Deltaproteobacteria bacterium RIFOXYB12_FULL_58_9]|nr:MAG: hypothetical protein A2341_09445 [Deltaproteobacteria bacterium RIFOXYB12_FULL_58_9]